MKYPKFFALILVIVIAYLVFSNGISQPSTFDIILKYLAAFTLGILYVYGFTAPFATGALLIMSTQQNIFFTGIIAGLGSMVGDLIIFRFIRTSFNDELKSLGKENFMKKIRKTIKNHSSLNKIIPFIAYIFIASPLPDEIGVALLASYKNTSTKIFSIFAYILNTIGIFIILILGRSF